MTKELFDRALSELWNRQPFHPFTVELRDGKKISIDRPGAVAIREGSAIYFTPKQYVRLNWSNVKQFIEGVDAMPTK